MKKSKVFTILAAIAIFVLACCVLVACNPTPNSTLPNVPGQGMSANTDVVKAFKAITPQGDVVTQTAALSNNKYAVTVITTEYVAEYILDKDMNIEDANMIAGEKPSAIAAETLPSALEKAYAEALRLSGLSAENVTGFDFDRDMYMQKQVYKVEIEEIGAKYKYIFAVDDFSLLNSEIEFENDLPATSYITESAAYELALRAAGVTSDVRASAVVRSEFEDGKKLYKVSFDFESYRYDVSVDAVSGDIVRFSKSALEEKTLPAVQQNMTAEQAKAVALGFVFPNGEQQTAYTFRKVKLDYENGMFVYEVELVAKNTEYEFEISATDGAILDVEIEGVKAAEPSPLPQDKQFITREQAIAAVKKEVGDVFVIEVEIDKEQGQYFYEIEVRLPSGVKREYKVNALTGEIIGNYAPSDAVILEADAVRAALNAFNLDEAAVTRKFVKLEREDGVLCFTVKLYVGAIEYEAEIDATTGAVLKQEMDNEGGSMPPSAGRLSEAEAIQRLKAEIGDVIIEDVELEFKNGKYVYEIEVIMNGREYDYYVDATTGEVSNNANFVAGSENVITEEEALSIAKQAFGVEGQNISLRKVKLERDDFALLYDIEFFIGSLKYEIEIDAVSGRVIEKDISYD